MTQKSVFLAELTHGRRVYERRSGGSNKQYQVPRLLPLVLLRGII